jgi:parallel beta-helix repeat protein
LGQIQGGDELYVKTGVYQETLYITGSLSGTADAPTVIKAYPEASVTLEGAGVDTGRIKIIDAAYIDFEGFTVTAMNQGIYVESCSQINIRNCTVDYIGQEGIHVMGNAEYVTIENCEISRTGSWMYNGEGVYVGTGSSGDQDNTAFVAVRNNVIHNTTDEGIEFKPGTHDCTAEGNVVYDVSTGETWGAIEVGEHSVGNQFWGENPNHVVRGNTIYSSDTAIRAGTGCLVYNNVIHSVRSGNYGIYLDNKAGDSYQRLIYHNTIDLAASDAVYSAGGASEVFNNIGPSSTGNLAADDSYFLDAAAHDYHLVADSAPIDTGMDLSGVIDTDKDGVARPAGNGYDLGAYELDYDGKPSAPQGLKLLSAE